MVEDVTVIEDSLLAHRSATSGGTGRRRRCLNTERSFETARNLVDDPAAAEVTSVGGWGPRIVGGEWLLTAGRKVDLLYRGVEPVREVIAECCGGRDKDGLSNRPPAWLLLGHVDGCNRALPAASRHAGCHRRAEGLRLTIPRHAAGRAVEDIPLGGPVQHRKR